MASKYRRALSGLTIAAALILTGSGNVFGDPILIANPAISAEGVAKDEVKDVFLGVASKVKGVKVNIAILSDGKLHEDFLKTYVAKTPQQFTNHWRNIVFSGKGAMPQSFKSEAELVTFVEKTPGAIAYIDSATPHSGVKVLKVE